MFSFYISDFSFFTTSDQVITPVTTDWAESGKWAGLVLQDTADTGRTREDVYGDVTMTNVCGGGGSVTCRPLVVVRPYLG